MEALRLHEHLEKLAHFESTARLGKVTLAARQLSVSQAAISRSIKILEDILQVPLLIRRQSGIELTDQGKSLFEFSKKVLNDTAELEKTIRGLNPNNITHLKVGTHEALAIHFWPIFLKKFSEDFPQIKVSLISGRIDALVSGLLHRHHDFLLSVEPLKNQKIESKILYSNRLRLYTSRTKNNNYPSLNKDQISIEELNSVPLLTDIASHSRQGLSMTNFLAAHGMELKNIFELNSFEASIRLAEQGQGVAVLPEVTGKNQMMERLKEIKVAKMTSKRFGLHNICMSFLKSNRESLAIKSILDSLEKYVST